MDQPVWAAVIPAYNAAKTIGDLVVRVSAYIPNQYILVVDDGSTDDTVEVLQSTDVQLQRRSINGGKGRALRDGLTTALQWHPEWVICLDADGQHDPEAIPLFQQKAAESASGLIIGSRRADLSRMPYARRFSNRFSSLLLSWRTGLQLADVQCGYRALRRDLLEAMTLRSERYDIEVEMILQTWRLKYQIGWVPVPTIYQNEQSFLKKFPETLRFLKLLAKSLYE